MGVCKVTKFNGTKSFHNLHTMNAKITSIQSTGQTWEKNGKKFYVYDVVLENGTTGQANSTDPLAPPYKVGDIVEYEITRQTDYGTSLKIKKADAGQVPAEGKSDETQRRIDASWAIGQAIQISISNGLAVDLRNENLMFDAKALLELRNKLMQS